ncbi:hypothetical protein X777_16102 [Ooceraea biroi]|uniref:Uncharacterized protein n=1 Tax=Ooceraea biroi TaxID=2015173 RepID=A0A026WXM7_OOCBI|nr:hypothetical protein X777_16102 [Ooceraea biroi]
MMAPSPWTSGWHPPRSSFLQHMYTPFGPQRYTSVPSPRAAQADSTRTERVAKGVVTYHRAEREAPKEKQRREERAKDATMRERRNEISRGRKRTREGESGRTREKTVYGGSDTIKRRRPATLDTLRTYNEDSRSCSRFHSRQFRESDEDARQTRHLAIAVTLAIHRNNPVRQNGEQYRDSLPNPGTIPRPNGVDDSVVRGYPFAPLPSSSSSSSSSPSPSPSSPPPPPPPPPPMFLCREPTRRNYASYEATILQNRPLNLADATGGPR